MGERLTAEREAAYRKAAARLDVREVHTAEVEAERFAAMTLLLVGVNDLLAELDAVRAERDEATTALRKINEIRNSIVGAQKVNFSEHIYPLVAALNEAGVRGLPYPEARENVGTLIDRANSAEAGLAALRDAAEAAHRILSPITRRGEAVREALHEALADTAAAAEAYRARVWRLAMLDAATECDARTVNGDVDCSIADVLRTMAEEGKR